MERVPHHLGARRPRGGGWSPKAFSPRGRGSCFKQEDFGRGSHSSCCPDRGRGCEVHKKRDFFPQKRASTGRRRSFLKQVTVGAVEGETHQGELGPLCGGVQWSGPPWCGQDAPGEVRTPTPCAVGFFGVHGVSSILPWGLQVGQGGPGGFIRVF